MKLHDLLKGLDIVSVTGDLNIDIANIAYDSRKVHLRKLLYLFYH